ncbi:uncharacterized protein [Clytia hemisphaerica]|uniref:DUF4201 domain-containing protein n=1 Tax=Clytia hemisphaerica TaxID=252671 RepID=A0A7M5UUP3_9CNID
MGKPRRNDAQLDKRALRKKAEHQGRTIEEEAVEEKESLHEIPQRWNDNPEPKRERKKNKRPKDAQPEEVCCTITTIPFIDESTKKLDHATGYTPEENKPKKETNSKRKLCDEIKVIPLTAKIEIVEIVQPEPIVHDIPLIQPCTAKKMNNFMRKQKYKRLDEKVEDVFDVDAEMQRISELLGDEEYLPSLTELQEYQKKESDRVTKKKSDTRTNFKNHFENAHRAGKFAMKIELFQEVIEQVEKTFGLESYKLIGDIPRNDADKITRRLLNIRQDFLNEVVDLRLKTNKCNEVYIRLLDQYKTHQSVADAFYERAKEKSNIGKNVLKNQIKLLDEAYSHLSTKGLSSFSKRPSTALKDWQKMIFSFASKTQNYEETIQHLTENIRTEQSRKETHQKKLEGFVEAYKKGLKKRAGSQQNYEDRVLKSCEYKEVCRTQGNIKQKIQKQREIFKQDKVDLEKTLDEVQDVGTKPPNYDHLTAKWRQTREELATDIKRTAELRKSINSIQESVRSKAGQVLELQINDDHLTKELNTLLEEKDFVNRQFHIAEYQRKKLNLQYNRIEFAH